MASPHLNPSPCEMTVCAVRRCDPITPLSCGVKGLAPHAQLYPVETQVFLQSPGSSGPFHSRRGMGRNIETHSPVHSEPPPLVPPRGCAPFQTGFMVRLATQKLITAKCSIVDIVWCLVSLRNMAAASFVYDPLRGLCGTR